MIYECVYVCVCVCVCVLSASVHAPPRRACLCARSRSGIIIAPFELAYVYLLNQLHMPPVNSGLSRPLCFSCVSPAKLEVYPTTGNQRPCDTGHELGCAGDWLRDPGAGRNDGSWATDWHRYGRGDLGTCTFCMSCPRSNHLWFRCSAGD